MVRLVDVAERAGVSLATVSRVINGTTSSGETYAKVQKALDELQYVRIRQVRQSATVEKLNQQAREIAKLKVEIQQKNREIAQLRAQIKLLGGD